MNSCFTILFLRLPQQDEKYKLKMSSIYESERIILNILKKHQDDYLG